MASIVLELTKLSNVKSPYTEYDDLNAYGRHCTENICQITYLNEIKRVYLPKSNAP